MLPEMRVRFNAVACECEFVNYDSGFGPNFDTYVGGKTGSSPQKFFDSLPLSASMLSLEARS